MHILGILFLIWIIRFLYSRNTANSPSIPWYLFLTPTLVSLTINLVDTLPLAYGVLVLIPGIIFSFPTFLAQGTIRLGMIRTSFLLGQLALATHRRDSFGGALFYGWLALKSSKPEDAAKGHAWLVKKLSNYKGQLKTGGMIVQILLKENNLDDRQMMVLFENLDFANKRLIPGNISRYAFRWCLARTLATGDWGKIGALAFQWYGEAWNPLAGWLVRECWVRDSDAFYPRSHPSRFFYFACAGFPRWSKLLPKAKGDNAPPSLRDATIKTAERSSLIEAEWWFKNTMKPRDKKLDKYWEYQSSQIKSDLYWQKRGRDLGVFDAEKTIDNLKESIRKNIEINDPESTMDNEELQKSRDSAFKLLKIKVNALNQRIEKNALMNDANEIEEWYAIVAILTPLLNDKWAKSQVFYILRDACWQWVADLWNKKKSKASAYLISGFLSPLAHTMGDKDSGKVFTGIVQDQFK